MIDEFIEDELIESVVKIGNHERIIKECEPNIFCPQELKVWMVKRTLYAWGLLENELYKRYRRSNTRNFYFKQGGNT